MIRKSRGATKAAKSLYLILVLAFLYLPILVMFGLLPIGMLAAGATVGFTICTIVAWTAWSDLRDARASCQAHAAGPPDSAR